MTILYIRGHMLPTLCLAARRRAIAISMHVNPVGDTFDHLQATPLTRSSRPDLRKHLRASLSHPLKDDHTARPRLTEPRPLRQQHMNLHSCDAFPSYRNHFHRSVPSRMSTCLRLQYLPLTCERMATQRMSLSCVLLSSPMAMAFAYSLVSI